MDVRRHEMTVSNPYRASALSSSQMVSNDSKVARGRDSWVRRFIYVLLGSFVAFVSAPLIWLALLVAFGAWKGEPLDVFRNRITWEDEFLAKLPAAFLIGSLGAFTILIGFLTERKPVGARSDVSDPDD
jgi:hypothetical protein